MEQTSTTARAIVIASKGPLDIAAITLMGLSTKRDDDSKIGMFGTGLKYSLAKLLRDGIAFRVFDGERELEITTRAGTFRDRPYEQILVNGETTSITTDMGPQWEPWWIVRELLSNARDEGEYKFNTCAWEAVTFEAGWTSIVLDYDTFEQVWIAREKYFVTDRLPKYTTRRGVKLLSRYGEGTRIYKNGILIHEAKEEDAFDYDVPDVELNEMREVRNKFELRDGISEAILRDVDDLALVRKYIEMCNTHTRYGKEVYSGDITAWAVNNLTLSTAWKEAIDSSEQPFHTTEGMAGEVNALPTDGIALPPRVYGIVSRHLALQRPLEVVEPNAEQKEMIGRALEVLFAVSFHVPYPIRVAELGPHTVGKVLDKTILLNFSKAFENVATLVSVLLEETMHINTGLGDNTRAFQNAIFQTWALSAIDAHERQPSGVAAAPAHTAPAPASSSVDFDNLPL